MIRDRIVSLERVRAGDLLANPGNWRTHPRAQAAAPSGLLSDIGYADALLARREGDSLVLVDGHLRASLDPDQLVPVLVLDLTQAEADMLLATLDPLAAMARPDKGALAELLARVSSSHDAVADLLEDLTRQAGIRRLLGDVEDIPSEVASRVSSGEIWQLGEHRLMCADATDRASAQRLMNNDRADVFLTDPPYGVGYVGKTAKSLRIKGDDAPGLGRLLGGAFAAADSMLSPGAAIYVFHPAGANQVSFLEAFLAQGWSLHQSLVWNKGRIVLGHSDYHFAHEPILYGHKPGAKRGRGKGGWYGGDDQGSVIDVPAPAVSALHPTAKPVALIRRLIQNSSRRGALIFDPFAGSGSTLLACEQMGRTARCMEIDPGYCDVILERWEESSGQRPRLFQRETA